MTLITNCDILSSLSISLIGIVIGFSERLLEIMEGVNTSISVCGFLNSPNGIWKSNLSGKIISINSTAKGLVSIQY